MKRLIKIILAASSIFGAIFLTNIPVHAETPNPPADFGYYDYDDGKIMLTYYGGTSKKVVIPDMIDGKTVYAVTRYAFENNSEVEEIYLPDTVEAVGGGAFSGCTNLKKIYLGSMKKPLDERLGFIHLLVGCPNLEWIGMSDEACFDLVSDSSGYFELFFSDTLTHLKYIYLGNSMTNIDHKLFYGDGLEYVEIGSGNPVFRSVNGVVYSADMKELIVCGTAYKDSVYEIPDGVEKIGTVGFYMCGGIERVRIPATVTEIGSRSFGKIQPVLEVRKDSYAEAWARRNGYETAYYGEALPEKEKISIEQMDIRLSQVSYTYDGGEKKPEVTVSASEYEKLTEGEDYTVSYENNVNAGTASARVTGINSYTGTVVLDFTIEEAGGNTDTEDDNPSGTDGGGDTGNAGGTGNTQAGSTDGNLSPSVGSKLTDGSSKLVYVVTEAGLSVSCVGIADKKAASVTIPSTVQLGGVTYRVVSVGAKAFKNCKKLKKVTVGTNITTIGKQAFFGCKSLKTITVKSKAITKIGSRAFKGVNKKAKIKVPKTELKVYKKLFKKGGLVKSAKIKK